MYGAFINAFKCGIFSAFMFGLFVGAPNCSGVEESATRLNDIEKRYIESKKKVYEK